MAYTPGANDSFGQGVDHTVNAGRGNDSSVTLGGGLQAVSDRWNGLTPHAVINTALASSQGDDGGFERFQRGQGGYEPGSWPTMQDQLDQGAD